MLKKLWPRIRRFFELFWKIYNLLIIVLFFLYLILLLSDDAQLLNTIIVNKAAIIGMMIALVLAMPGYLSEEFIKKRYVMTSICPNCKNEIQVKLEEK